MFPHQTKKLFSSDGSFILVVEYNDTINEKNIFNIIAKRNIPIIPEGLYFSNKVTTHYSLL